MRTYQTTFMPNKNDKDQFIMPQFSDQEDKCRFGSLLNETQASTITKPSYADTQH